MRSGIPNFGIKIPIFWLSRHRNSRKKFPTGIFGIVNGIGIPLPKGVPEIGTKNWNSQPSWYRTGLIWEQVPDKLWTSFGKVLYKFCFETCIWTGLDRFFSCVDILVYVSQYKTGQIIWEQAPNKFQTSSGQVPDKFRTSFVFKLAPDLSENQTCSRVARFYIGICGCCTGGFRVVEKSNLSASCTPSDNYFTSF